jgi:hypothetical protein
VTPVGNGCMATPVFSRALAEFRGCGWAVLGDQPLHEGRTRLECADGGSGWRRSGAATSHGCVVCRNGPPRTGHLARPGMPGRLVGGGGAQGEGVVMGSHNPVVASRWHPRLVCRVSAPLRLRKARQWALTTYRCSRSCSARARYPSPLMDRSCGEERVGRHRRRRYFELLGIFFRHDPIGINFDENVDEYAPEVETILPRVPEAVGIDSLTDLLHQEFDHWFSGVAGPRERYLPIAREVWSWWQSALTFDADYERVLREWLDLQAVPQPYLEGELPEHAHVGFAGNNRVPRRVSTADTGLGK